MLSNDDAKIVYDLLVVVIIGKVSNNNIMFLEQYCVYFEK